MPRLTPEQRADLERQLKDDDDAADDEYEYEIGSGDRYARIPARSKAGRRLSSFFKESFGIDLDDEPVQDDAGDDSGKGQQGKGQQGGQVKAFRSGPYRRTG